MAAASPFKQKAFGNRQVGRRQLSGQRWLTQIDLPDWIPRGVLGVGHFGFGRLRPRGVLTATLIISSIVLAACNSATLSGGDHGDANVLDKSAP
jgi:hypothetical protein